MKNLFKVIWKAMLSVITFLLPFIQEWIVPTLDIIDLLKESLTTKTKLEILLSKFFNGDAAKVEETIKKIIDAFNNLSLDLQVENMTPEEAIIKIMEWLAGQPSLAKDAVLLKLASQYTKLSGAPELKDHQLDTMIQVAYSLKKEGKLS